MADVKLNDKGFNAIVSRDKLLATKVVRAGILDPEQAEKALYNEFGTATTPARPFMRQTFDTQLETLVKEVISTYRSLGVNLSIEQALEALGARYVQMLQEEIRKGNFTPNTLETQKEKGSSTPLIDTGEMLRSITFEVK